MANNMQYGYSNQNQMPSYGYQQSYQGQYQQPYNQSYGQSYAQQPAFNRVWADGEFEARSKLIPDGWPPDTPYVIWDSRQPIQYIKSIDARGVPYPMKILKYEEIQQRQQSFALPGQAPENVEFVTKADFNNLKEEMMEAIRTLMPQQHSQANQQNNQSNQRGAK